MVGFAFADRFILHVRMSHRIVGGSRVGIERNDSIAWRQGVGSNVCVPEANLKPTEIDSLQLNDFRFHGDLASLAVDAEGSELSFQRLQIAVDIANTGCENWCVIAQLVERGRKLLLQCLHGLHHVLVHTGVSGSPVSLCGVLQLTMEFLDLTPQVCWQIGDCAGATQIKIFCDVCRHSKDQPILFVQFDVLQVDERKFGPTSRRAGWPN